MATWIVPIVVLAAAAAFLAAPCLAEETTPAPSWAALVDAARGNPQLSPHREKLIASARAAAGRPITRRVDKYEDIGKERTWLDGRTRAMEGQPRQSWFGLAMSDFGTSGTLNSELPLLAVAFRLTGDAVFKERIVAQLEESVSWSPLQRPGWSLCVPGADPVPPDFKDGNWLATGLGVRALADTLELMPAGSLPQPLVAKVHTLLEKEIRSIADDWHTKRSWFISANYPRTNQWVLPTEGLIRACLVVGKEKHAEEYEMGVRNLLAALDAQGARGEFYEGIGYANFTLESMLHAAHAMAAAGDPRGLSNPFLRRFPTWMVHHLQPGRFRINCFDAGGARATAQDGSFRGLLSLFLVLSNDPVARWALSNQFAGPSDDMIGILARATAGEEKDPGLFAAYVGAARVNWRYSWADAATGVWVRGGHPLDSHDHYDRGHVNFILKGKPLLIEAGTPGYENPNIHVLYSTVVGHNVLAVEGFTPKKAPAPITVRRLDAAGGAVVVDGTACHPGLKQWQRQVSWSADHLAVTDEVRFPDGKTGAPLLRWHLGTDQPVEITATAGGATVTWADGQVTFESKAPLAVTQEMLPDNTVNLGKKIGPDHLHTCVLVRVARPCAEWVLNTRATAR